MPLSAGDEARAVTLAALLAVITGVIVIAAGIARLGFLTALLSAPVRVGYLNGIALIVIVGQLPKLFGFSVDADGLVAETAAFVEGLIDGETIPVALAIGVVSLAVIFGFRRWRPTVPGILIAVVGATVVSAVLDLSTRSGLPVVGPLPVGLPPLTIPSIAPGDIVALLPAALGIALVSATDMSVLSRSLSIRRGEEVSQDRELIGLGGADLATGFFSGMPVSSSASRTPVAESAGAQTQLTGVVGALLVCVLLVALPDLLAPLPASALAAVVIAAALSLADVGSMVRLWRIGSMEFWLALVTFLGVAFVGVIEGVFLAVGLSLIEFIQRAWWPHDAVLGRADGVKGYHDLHFYPDARQVPGLLLYRFDAPLFFANAEVFRDRLRERIAKADEPIRWVVIAAEPITDVDTTAAAVLDDLRTGLDRRGITLAFAELKDPIKAKLRRYGALTDMADESMFPTVGTAVSAYVKATGQGWTDWEEGANAPRGPRR